MDFPVLLKNAMLEQIETFLGASAKLRFYSGAKPAVDAAPTGTLLSEMQLPADWLADPVNAVKSLSGTWEDADGGNAAGNLGWFRFYDNAGATIGPQGTVGGPGSGADIEVDNTNIAIGQDFGITSFNFSI